MSTEPMIEVSGLTKRFGRGDAAVTALEDVDLTVPRGGLVAVTGRSGSGKTTLLHCIGGLERPDAGRVVVDGTEVTDLDEDGLLALRRDHVGFVFQTFALVPILTARENVGIPLRLGRTPAKEREAQVERLLRLVGLADHTEQRPGELSGGQQQRVAVARALAGRPSLLLADEPTGQLDSATGRAVMELLRAVVASEGVTAVVATHDPALIDVADAVHELSDGRLVDRRLRGRALGCGSCVWPRSSRSSTAGTTPPGPSPGTRSGWSAATPTTRSAPCCSPSTPSRPWSTRRWRSAWTCSWSTTPCC